MKLGRSTMATGVLGVLMGAIAVGAAWAASREPRPPSSRHATPSAGDGRIAALEARLTRVERALALLSAREVDGSDTRSTVSAATRPKPDEVSEAAADEGAAPADADRALRALHASLDQRLEAERPDPEWRPESAIRDAIASLSTRPALVSTECVATFCRVELLHRALDERDATAEQIARLRPFAEGTLYRDDPAEPLRLVLYVQRPSHAFGNETSLPSPTEP